MCERIHLYCAFYCVRLRGDRAISFINRESIERLCRRTCAKSKSLHPTASCRATMLEPVDVTPALAVEPVDAIDREGVRVGSEKSRASQRVAQLGWQRPALGASAILFWHRPSRKRGVRVSRFSALRAHACRFSVVIHWTLVMIELSTDSHWTLAMQNLDFGDDSLDSSDANRPESGFSTGLW
jgi:hypothetical protein